jgi:hypothetical protein
MINCRHRSPPAQSGPNLKAGFLLNAAKVCVLAKPVPALRLNAALRVTKRARNDGFPAHENCLPRQRNMTTVSHW